MSVTTTNFQGETGGNVLLTPDVIAREALMILEGNILAPSVMKTSAAAEWAGSKVGDTVRVRRPAFFGVDDYSPGTAHATTIKVQDAQESSVDLKIEHHYDVSFEVSSKELTLNMDDFSDRLLKPAMSALSAKIEKYALSKIEHLGILAESTALTAFTAHSSMAEMSRIVQQLNIHKVPQQNRKMIISPVAQTEIYTIENFVQAQMSGDARSPVQDALLGRFMGMDMMMALDLPTHSVGTFLRADGEDTCAIDVTNGYAEGTTSVVLKTLPNVTTIIGEGDTLRIGYADGVTRDHRVAANATIASSAVAGGVTISPGLWGCDADAVDGGPPLVVLDDAVVEVVGGTSAITSYTVGGVFVPEAFQLVFVPQPAPMGPGTSAATVSYNGMSLRVLQTFDHIKKRDLISVDAMVGCACVDARLGARLPSTGG